jgi:tRNA(fMet)-specific endonuclease VapC
VTDRYLLDSNILSDLLRNPHGLIAEGIRHVGPDAVCTSVIVAAELRYGGAKRMSVQLITRIEVILAALEVMPFDDDASHEYAHLRAELEGRGQPIGANDLLIAAHALATKTILVTHNTREFGRVRGLRVEDWLAPAP